VRRFQHNKVPIPSPSIPSFLFSTSALSIYKALKTVKSTSQSHLDKIEALKRTFFDLRGEIEVG
jgi:hypothetical protein